MKQVLLVALLVFCGFALSDQEYLAKNTLTANIKKMENNVDSLGDITSCIDAIE